jgi:hypothetical protein
LHHEASWHFLKSRRVTYSVTHSAFMSPCTLSHTQDVHVRTYAHTHAQEARDPPHRRVGVTRTAEKRMHTYTMPPPRHIWCHAQAASRHLADHTQWKWHLQLIQLLSTLDHQHSPAAVGVGHGVRRCLVVRVQEIGAVDTRRAGRRRRHCRPPPNQHDHRRPSCQNPSHHVRRRVSDGSNCSNVLAKWSETLNLGKTLKL